MNENDVWLLVRAVRDNRYGQTNCRVEPGEKAAARRLFKRGLVGWANTYSICPTEAGFRMVDLFGFVLKTARIDGSEIEYGNTTTQNEDRDGSSNGQASGRRKRPTRDPNHGHLG